MESYYYIETRIRGRMRIRESPNIRGWVLASTVDGLIKPSHLHERTRTSILHVSTVIV